MSRQQNLCSGIWNKRWIFEFAQFLVHFSLGFGLGFWAHVGSIARVKVRVRVMVC